jgi:hypothetical protein
MPERSWSSVPFRAFPSPGAMPPLGGLMPSCRYERSAQLGPRVQLRRPGTSRSTDCLTSRKVMQVRRHADPNPRLECRLQGFAPRDESVADARCLSASRVARCSPGFRCLSRVLPLDVAPCSDRSRRRASSRELGICNDHAPPATRGPPAEAVTRISALLGVLTTSRLARVRENTEQTLVRFTYLIRVLLSMRAASPWL